MWNYRNNQKEYSLYKMEFSVKSFLKLINYVNAIFGNIIADIRSRLVVNFHFSHSFTGGFLPIVGAVG